LTVFCEDHDHLLCVINSNGRALCIVNADPIQNQPHQALVVYINHKLPIFKASIKAVSAGLVEGDQAALNRHGGVVHTGSVTIQADADLIL